MVVCVRFCYTGKITIDVGNHQNIAFLSKSLDMSRPFIIIIIVVVVVVVVVIVNFLIGYPGCILTRRRRSQIGKESYIPSIFIRQESMFVRIESIVPPNGKMCEMIDYVCQPWIEHPAFVPHGWTVYNITVHFSHYRSGH